MVKPVFPGAEQVAKLELEYKLGKCIRDGNYASVLSSHQSHRIFLQEYDLTWLSDHGVRWSNFPQHNSITRLLKEHLEKLLLVGIELAYTKDGVVLRRIAARE